MSGKRTGVGLFCATFLKPEMLHIHRHVTGLKNFRPVVLTQKREGEWSAERIHVIKRSHWRFLSRAKEKRTGEPWQISRGEVRRMIDALEKEGCELLHVFFGNAAVHLLPLLRECPVPVLVSFHGSDVAGSMKSPAYAEAVKELFSLVKAVPCRSEQLAGAVAALGCPQEKLRLMRTVLPEIPLLERTTPPDGAWRIVQAARLVPKKGILTALAAFKTFSEKYPNATFTIAGEGPQEESLRAEAERLGIGGRVIFTGFLSQEKLQCLFLKSHIFLHPSETADGDVEGIPNAMLESMASGLPVVATRHGGIPEVISDEINGLLCPEADIRAVTTSLFRLAEDQALYGNLAKQGAASVREQFSMDRQIEAIEIIYREAILA